MGDRSLVLRRADDDVAIEFDPGDVDVPDDFEPDESILQTRSTFERVLEAIVDDGIDKQTAVAEINKLQSELAVPIEAAAVLYGRREGVDLHGLARQVMREIEESSDANPS